MDFSEQHANGLSNHQSSEANEDIGTDQPDPVTYSNRAVVTRTLDCLVSVVFLPRSVMYADGLSGLVQNFFCVGLIDIKTRLFNIELQNYRLKQTSNEFISETKQDFSFYALQTEVWRDFKN